MEKCKFESHNVNRDLCNDFQLAVASSAKRFAISCAANEYQVGLLRQKTTI